MFARQSSILMGKNKRFDEEKNNDHQISNNYKPKKDPNFLGLP